jgi:acetyl esterase/lipase
MMNKVAVPIALALHAKWRLPVCDYVQLGESGPGAYIFCATSLTQLGPHPKVLFYFFGGGFIGNLFSGDISFITSWAQAFPDVIIVCPQYDIAPEPYPVALNQCVAAYMAVMKHGILGCMPSSCVISGQSAGGMLAASLCVRLAQKGGRGGGALRSGQVKRSTKATAGGGKTSSKADSGSSHRSKYHHHHHTGFRDEVKALVMWYPTLNASLAPSPSRVLFVNDVLLPHGLTSAAVDSYVPENKDANDPCCSPVFASDETLARFPQTYIIAAGLDPLLDDSVDFHTRLCRNRSPAKLKIWRGLTHGFMNMDAVNAEAAEAQASTVEMLREALYE